MGIFTGISNVGSRLATGYGSGRQGLQAARAAVGEKAGSALGYTAEKVGYALGRTGPMMALGIAAGAAAVLGGVAYVASRVRKSRKADQAQEDAAQREQAVMAALPAVDGPADGRAENAWRQQVLASRGQAPAAGANVNPAMNVVPENTVQNLGSVR